MTFRNDAVSSANFFTRVPVPFAMVLNVDSRFSEMLAALLNKTALYTEKGLNGSQSASSVSD